MVIYVPHAAIPNQPPERVTPTQLVAIHGREYFRVSCVGQVCAVGRAVLETGFVVKVSRRIYCFCNGHFAVGLRAVSVIPFRAIQRRFTKSVINQRRIAIEIKSQERAQRCVGCAVVAAIVRRIANVVQLSKKATVGRIACHVQPLFNVDSVHIGRVGRGGLHTVVCCGMCSAFGSPHVMVKERQQCVGLVGHRVAR